MDKIFQRAPVILLIVPLALLAGAYAFQYLGGLFPCPLCWWQRYALFVAIPPAILAQFKQRGKTLFLALASLAILAGGLIAGFHSGVELHWWEGLQSCADPYAQVTDIEELKKLLEGPAPARCDEIPWSLFGLSMANYNFFISSVVGIFGLMSLRKMEK